MMKSIEGALRRSEILALEYVDVKGKRSSREVEPYSLSLEKGELMAYCLIGQGIRNFKLSRIIQADSTGVTFTPRWDRQIDGKFIDGETTQEDYAFNVVLSNLGNEHLFEMAAFTAKLVAAGVERGAEVHSSVLAEMKRRMQDDKQG